MKFKKDKFERFRLEIEREYLSSLLKELKEKKNLSIKKISEIIGTNLKNYIYGYTDTLNGNSVINLEKLIGKEIPYKIKYEIGLSIKNVRENYESRLFKNKNLAEMVGIILGDGYLFYLNNKYGLIISLSKNEQNYITYVTNLMEKNFSKLFIEGKTVSTYDNTGNGIKLTMYGKEIVKELISHGLIPGNKVKHQISVPSWIKKSKEWIEENYEKWENFFKKLVIKCLKGLMDTDGSISINIREKSISVTFKNASLPLAIDFKEMCESLGIKPHQKVTNARVKSKITGKELIGYQVTISSKREIKKFIDLIKPKKWEFNIEKLNKKLNELGTNIYRALEYDK